MAPLVAVEFKPEVLYRVGKHSRPLSDYSLWARWLIRAVYFLTGYQTTSEDIAIASSTDKADEMCVDGSYFYKPLYVDVPLPDEPCAIGPVVWPRSEARKLYERHTPDMVAIPRQDFEALRGAVDRTCQTAHAR